MSARKRARISEAVANMLAHQPKLQLTHSVALTTGWRTIPAELLQRATTFLLRFSTRAQFGAIQLLLRLSSGCADWRSVVYRPSSNGSRHVDFWSLVGTVSVGDTALDVQAFSIAGQQRSASVVPGALSSMRSVRSLVLRLGVYPDPCGLAAFVCPLQLSASLTALDIELEAVSDAGTVTRQRKEDARNALTAALASIAAHNRLRALALHYPPYIQLAVDVLSRLCSPVVQLSAPSHAILSTASAQSSGTAWQARSVQSFVVSSRAPATNFDDKRVAGAVVASLRSLTHLHVECEQTSTGMRALLQQLGSRLTFLRCRAGTDQLWRFGVTCSALVSLHVGNIEGQTWSGNDISGLLAQLQSCSTLAQLTIVLTPVWPWYNHVVAHILIHALPPRLTYLHLRLPCYTLAIRAGQSTPDFNLTHLALQLHASQPTALLDSIDGQSQPHLTHCHVNLMALRSGVTASWLEAKSRLKERLGAAWCNHAESVFRWRADRVWKRAAGLPDEPDVYSA